MQKTPLTFAFWGGKGGVRDGKTPLLCESRTWLNFRELSRLNALIFVGSIMSTSPSRLSLKKFEANGGKWIEDESAIHVQSPHLLTQIAGYAKFKLGRSNSTIIFRGQSNLHGSLKASIHRIGTDHSINAIYQRHHKLNKYIKATVATSAFLRGTLDYVFEPLLQQYGLNTRWIDAVDNIWSALWFACHDSFPSGIRRQFLSFERRFASPGKNNYAYILLLEFDDLVTNTSKPGSSNNRAYETIDLRIAAPSIFIRPHAQHGILFRKREINTIESIDCAENIFGIIRLDIDQASSWLGLGELTAIRSFFPSPFYDLGYRRLLEVAPPGDHFLGPRLCH